jgi:2'-5' RNA ligase
MTREPVTLPPEREGQILSYTYCFVLLPNQALNEKAIALSEKLAELYSTRFTLDKRTIPHYSIYMAQLDDKGLVEAKKRLKAIAARFFPFNLQTTHYWQDPAESFFEIQYEKTPQLIQLQEKIIAQVDPLRQGRFLKEFPPGYTKNELESQLKGNALEQFKKYGYPEVGEDYRPHMTFTRLMQKCKEAIDKEKIPEAFEFNGIYSSLGIFVMGKNGTCVKEIALLPLEAKRN